MVEIAQPRKIELDFFLEFLVLDLLKNAKAELDHVIDDVMMRPDGADHILDYFES